MKSSIAIFIFFSLTFSSYSQDKNNASEGDNKMVEFPEVVIKSAEKVFSAYIPDKNPDERVRALQEKFIDYNLDKANQRTEAFLVTMETSSSSLVATYNENGNLSSIVENYKDVRLPREVIESIFKTYPGWIITNDKFIYSQEDGAVIKKQYNLKIKKGNETRKLVVHPNGDILSGL